MNCGIGLTHNWGVRRQLITSVTKPVIFSDGLNPSNVVVAIRKVKPYGVDVNSGVDDSKGNTNVATFIDSVKNGKSVLSLECGDAAQR